MKINNFFLIVLMMFWLPITMAQKTPNDLFLKEKYKRFVKKTYGDYYTIEKYDLDFIRVYEKRSLTNNNLIEKYEAEFINPKPINGVLPFSLYYQINKNYKYENGIIASTNYKVGYSENCFVKCGDENFYKDSKIYKTIKYPSCLSLIDMDTRQLKYENEYVKKNCE